MPEPTRKLAAIVFTDIVGFTKLTAKDQSKASALLKQQRELFRPIVDSYKGMWVKEMGDGLLLTFDTVTDAVNCCIKLQEASKQIDDLDLRIGIHQGEILLEENDVIGDDVNVAARIEPFSAPGGIAISNKVNDAIVRESDFTTKYLGKPKLKGVGQEVKVYCITSHDLPETKLSDVSAKLEPEGFQWNVMNSLGIAASVVGLFLLINFMFLRIGYGDEEKTPSVAILPFENKGAPEDEFYVFGIGSDLHADVSSAGMIRVASLSDIENIDYQNMDNHEIAEALSVRYISHGTLWKIDTVFQMSIELYDTKTKQVIFTKRWQTAWKDLATIKDDLADNILTNLEIEVIHDPEIVQKTNPEAYEYYLKAKYKYQTRESMEDTEVARGFFRKSYEIDPTLYESKLALGTTYKDIGDLENAEKHYREVLNSKGSEKNPLIKSDAMNNVGIIFYWRRELDSAEVYWRQSMELRENAGNKKGLSGSLHNLGNIFSQKGEHDVAIDYYKRASVIMEEMDNKPWLANATNALGIMYYQKNELSKSLEYYQKAKLIRESIGDNFGLSGILVNIGNVYRSLGNLDQSIEYYLRGMVIMEELQANNWLPNAYGNCAYAHRNKGEFVESSHYFNKLLDLTNRLDNQSGIANSHFELALNFYYQQDFENSRAELLKAVKIEDESYPLFIGVLNKHKGKDYSKEFELVKEELDTDQELDPRTYYFLNILLDDPSYLQKAYDTMMEVEQYILPEFKESFNSYPIHKLILDAKNKPA